MSEYYYGEIDQEKYYHQDIEECLSELLELAHEENPTFKLIEFKSAKSSGFTYCQEYELFDPDECEFDCDEYYPKNGVKGACKTLSYGLIETGATWEYKDGKLKKLTGRKLLEKLKGR